MGTNIPTRVTTRSTLDDLFTEASWDIAHEVFTTNRIEYSDSQGNPNELISLFRESVYDMFCMAVVPQNLSRENLKILPITRGEREAFDRALHLFAAMFGIKVNI